MKQITCLSLFSGCGGLDLGFSLNGYDIIAAYDNWSPAVDNHNKNKSLLGGIAIRRSLALSDNEIKLSELPKVDLVLGGPPCQGYSFAGKQQIDDPRNTLYLDFKMIVAHIKPRAFLMENVRGLERMALPEIEKSFATIGYQACIQRVKAIDLGIAQRRERVIIVGTPKDRKRFVTPEVLMGGLFGAQSPKNIFQTIGDLPKPPMNGKIWEPKGSYLDDHIYLPLSKLEQSFIRHIPNGGSYSDAPRETLPKRLKKIFDNPRKYKSPRLFPKPDPLSTVQTIPASTSPSIGGVIAPDFLYKNGVATLINCDDYKSKNRAYTAPHESRRFTPREIARLQTFPDEFLFEGSISTKTKLIGNAVPFEVAQLFAKEIRKQVFEKS